MTAPPKPLTADQKATAARLRAAGVPPGLALDGALGRIAEADLIRWAAEYAAARSEALAKWGWQTRDRG